MKTKLLLLSFIWLVTNISCHHNDYTPIEVDDDYQTKAIKITQMPEVVFNDIKTIAGGGTSNTILVRLENYIDATLPGESIYFSVYLMNIETSNPTIPALKRAAERGVKIYAQIDESSAENIGNNQDAIKAIKDFATEFYITKNNINTSAGSINHSKFMLFSKIKTTTGELENIIFHSSSNFFHWQNGYIQDNITLSDKALYNIYMEVWNELRDCALGTKQYTNIDFKEFTQGNTTLYFYPYRKGGVQIKGDPILTLYDNIKDKKNATIRIANFKWTNARKNILDKLFELQEEGAKIEVIVSVKSAKEILNRLEELKEKGAYVKILPFENATGKKSIHSKVFMIEEPGSKIIISGTANITSPALKYSQESQVLFRNDDYMYNKYLNDFFNVIKNTNF